MASPKTVSPHSYPVYLKPAGLAAAGVLLAYAFGYLGAFLSLRTVPVALIVLVAFLAVLPMQALFFSSGKLTAAVVLAEGVAMTLPFLLPPSLLVLCAGLMLVFFLLKASWCAARTAGDQLTIRFFGIAWRFLPTAFTGIALFIALTYVNSFHFSMQELSRGTWTHLEQPYELMARPLGFSLTITPRKAIEQFLVTQGGPQIQKLSAAQKKTAINTLEGNLRTKMKQYGVTWKEGETLSDIAYRLVSTGWVKAPTALKVLIPVNIGIVAYVAMKFLGMILWRLSGFLALLLYKICLWTGFARITVEKKDKQVIVCA